MPRPAAAIALVILAFARPPAALAQTSPPSPGPYVIDLRAYMSGLPSDSAFHPQLPAAALVPKRGFGPGAGAHVYVASLGIARIGIGADVLRVRGTATTPAAAATTPSTQATTTSAVTQPGALSALNPIDVATTMTAVAPQVSFNFGTRDGWSYLSGGYGAAQIRTAATGQATSAPAGTITVVSSGGAGALNFGGGARWFVRERVAVGFDVRFLRVGVAGTRPSTRYVAVSLGLSVR